MGVDTIFAAMGIIIILGFLADLIFSRTDIPDVIWLILIGIFIGPVMGWISPGSTQEAAAVFTSFALLFILFEGGLHIRIKDLMRSMYGGTAITVLNFVITAAVITLIAQYFGFHIATSLLLGLILGGTSSAVVVPIVSRLNMGKNNSLVLILESAFSDVLVIVATLTAIQIITLNAINAGGVLNALFGSFAIAIFVGGIAGFLWILLLERFTLLAKSYMSTVGMLLIVFGLTEFAQSSGAIAGLTFGIVMGNSRKILSLAEHVQDETLTASAREFFSQISFFVKTFFFVYIGILTSFTSFEPILLGFIVVLAAFLLRPIAVKAAFKPEGPKDKPIMEAMIPKGLAAAVLVQLPLQAGIAGADRLLTPVFAAIFFSIALTTILVFLIKHDRYPGTSVLIGMLYHKLTGKGTYKAKANKQAQLSVQKRKRKR